MKNYEKESLLKSFLLFFTVQCIFLFIVIYQNYHKVLHEYDMNVANQMMQAHINDEYSKFETIYIEDIKDENIYTLYRDDDIYMIFKDNKQYIKMLKDKNTYLEKRNTIKIYALLKYLLYLIVLAMESLLFGMYAIKPLKKALILNEEFVKDILHDFNTPLSALKINLRIIENTFGNDDAINRSYEAIEKILSLQGNMQYYLSQNKLENEKINLREIIKQRVLYFQVMYPKLDIIYTIEAININIIKDVFIRIIDNLLSNASTYNKEYGSIKIVFKNKLLTIEDTGIGIKNPKDIFKRYYVENTKGIGIGLHIVEKLCQELSISVTVESTLGVGTKFTLNLSEIL